MATITQFEDLDIWKIAREICQEVYRLTNTSPFDKDFSLKDQIRRKISSFIKYLKNSDYDGTKYK